MMSNGGHLTTTLSSCVLANHVTGPHKCHKLLFSLVYEPNYVVLRVDYSSFTLSIYPGHSICSVLAVLAISIGQRLLRISR
jgi:hypothetical protein